jgi:hypothetical protein
MEDLVLARERGHGLNASACQRMIAVDLHKQSSDQLLSLRAFFVSRAPQIPPRLGEHELVVGVGH